MPTTLVPFDTQAEYPFWAGFRGSSTGTHATRSMMIDDLTRILASVPADAPREAYVEAIQERNILNKRTATTRRETLQRLSEFYAFDPEVPLFRALRTLWDAGESARPLLALLSSAARDVLLRVSAVAVLPLETGALFDKEEVVAALERELPSRFTPSSRAQISRIVAASWTQAGHLEGHSRKVRRHVDPAPAAVAYAVLLGYLCGERGEALFTSPWALCLDAPAPVLEARARDAARHGWISYRRSGGVLDVDPGPLLTREEFEQAI